ncbi:hypothetical protein B0H11DRAFT_2277774 [Mycena galericulata]|nr:hypothetical protein B0H11DRAFT_2277774 [Mycena galericulata]
MRRSSRSPPRRSRSPTRRGSSNAPRHSSPSRGRDGRDYKTAYLALKASNDIQQKKRARKAEKGASTQAMGRGIRMVAALFGEVATIIQEAEAYQLAPLDDVDFDESTKDLSEEQKSYLQENTRERNLAAYAQIKRIVPNIQQKLLMYENEDCVDELVEFYASLQKGANDSRSDDFSRVSAALGNWINQERDRPDLAVFDHTPPIIDQDGKTIKQYAPLLSDDRETRGVQNDYCLGLLAPIEHDVADEEIRIALRGNSTTIKLNESFYARLFYSGFQGDPEDVDNGFLKSRYLVKGYKSIFTGPASAKEHAENPPEKRPRTSGKAIRKPPCEILHMKGQVTGRSIGYVCVIEHQGLTTARQWTPEYYGISYPQMYNFIVDYFEAPLPGTPERAHADALLKWWNQQIFPNHASSASTNSTAVNSMAKLRAQRLARAEAEAAAVAAEAEAEAAAAAQAEAAAAAAAGDGVAAGDEA